MAVIPSWLDAFLGGNYFAHCRSHVSSKNERNHFCVDCCEGPMCQSGLQRHHQSHTTLQVRRASHMDAVRISDIHKLIDTSGIQQYTINGAKIVFLLTRPQSRLAKGSIRCCESCGRGISDPVRFCSISCKLACVVASYDDTTTIAARPSSSSASGMNEDDRQSKQGNNNIDIDPHSAPSSSSPTPSDDRNACHRKRTRQEHNDNDNEEARRPPPFLEFKRSKLQIIVKDPRDPTNTTTPGSTATHRRHLVLPSPNSVLASDMVATPTQCRSLVLVSASSPPRSHRKGTPHRSPLF